MVVGVAVATLFLVWQLLSVYLDVAYSTDLNFLSEVSKRIANRGYYDQPSSTPATALDLRPETSPPPLASDDISAMVAASLQQLATVPPLPGTKGETGPPGPAGRTGNSGHSPSLSLATIESSLNDLLNIPDQILLPIANGGLGLNTIPTAGQLLIGNGTGYALTSSPQLVTPVLGVATATSLNKLTITPPATGSTLTIADGKVLGVNNSLTFTGTDSTAFTLPSVSDNLVGRTSTDTLVNKTIAAGTNSISGLTNTNLSGAAGITNGNLANASVTINPGVGISGGGSVALGSNITLTNAGVTALNGTTDQVNISGSTGSVTLSLPQSIGPTSTPTFASINGLSFTAASDGLTISGGTTSRTLTVSGGNITLSGDGHTLTLGADVSVNQSLNINSSPTFGGLALAGDLVTSANIIGNNPAVTSGTLANTAISGTCVLNLNAAALAAFQSSATVTTSHIFYNSTRNRHSRIGTVTTCTDGSGNPWRVLTLSDSISGNAAGDSYTIYQNNTNLGTTASGFIGTVNAVSLRSLVSTLTGGFDIAEQYPSSDPTLAAGDLISMDPAQPGFIRKSEGLRDPYLLGVISSSPALTLGDETPADWKSVALAGRVPVKVTGTVNIGDYLTSSDLPGVATRATKAGNVIGRALEDHEGDETESITMFVMTGQTMGSIAEDPGDPLTALFEKILDDDVSNPSIIAADSIAAKSIGALTLSVDKIISAVGEALRIETDINLLGRIDFDSDTGGYAEISSGESEVEVTFQRPFGQTPVVTATLVSNPYPAIGINYFLTEITEDGFVIQVTEPAAVDISFSWLALSIKNKNGEPSTKE